MNRIARFTLPLALALLATGCMTTYKIAPGTPSASLTVGGKRVLPWICMNGPAQRLIADKDGRIRIPAGERVTIGANYMTSNGRMNYSCSPRVNLVPEADVRYLQNFETEREACSALIYRETDDKRVGLAFDPTMKPGGGNCVKK